MQLCEGEQTRLLTTKNKKRASFSWRACSILNLTVVEHHDDLARIDAARNQDLVRMAHVGMMPVVLFVVVVYVWWWVGGTRQWSRGGRDGRMALKVWLFRGRHETKDSKRADRTGRL